MTEPIPPAADSVQGTSPEANSPDNPSIGPKASPPKIWLIIGAAVVILGGLGIWFMMSHTSRPTAVAPTPKAETGVLRVATTLDEDGLAAATKEYQPFLDYLASQLHDQGITKVEFVDKASVSEIAKELRQGQIDLYIDSMFPVFVADRLSNSELMADRWKSGVEKYHTAIFVKRSSNIKTLADLKGKMLALDSSISTSGYFLPKAELIKAGYKLTEKQKTTDAVAADEIGYVFVHDKVFESVQTGATAAGGENELEIRGYFGATFDQDYRIILTSPDVLRYAVTGRKDLDPKLRAAIKSALLGMDKTEAGKAALKQFSKTAKFTDVPTDSDAAYGEIQKLTDYVEDEIVSGGVGAGQ